MARRRPSGIERRHRISSEAVEAFKLGRAFHWRTDEHWRHYWTLHKALGLKPWQICPLGIDPDEPDPKQVDWAEMRELRLQLEALADAERVN